MNILIDTMVLRMDLGYQFSSSLHKVNILQYADDTCLVTNSPASCQFLLSKVSNWLTWSGMSAKVPICQCKSIQGSTGRLLDLHLQLNGASIPLTTNPMRFLGMNVQVPNTKSSAKSAIVSHLRSMLTAVDDSLLTRRQRLLLYSAGVCPRLTWPLIQEFPVS